MITIATAEIAWVSILNEALCRQRLAETRNNENGALHRLVSHIKQEDAKSFEISNITLGKEEDNFLFLYYANGVRYKIFKNGEIMVASADVDEDMSSPENEFKEVINMIVADEIACRIKKAISNNQDGIVLGKSRPISKDPNIYNKVACALSDSR